MKISREQWEDFQKSPEWKGLCLHLAERESRLTRRLVDSPNNPEALSGALSDSALKAQIRALRYIQFSLVPELMDGGEEKDETKNPMV